ncbi:MAG: phospho-N-acetylmuramoyl-pentapeptide-transferase [Verrucomicrobia bacterium]|nr:phospho-N-acetylmuramoyl-pentapeptide-transferase [Verrucomicrobiota bacterium]NBR47573.1 phospho-N-acetylmuramoyl-pentapeptide-transferase [bacterium]NBS51047.1 phospho-N-acetylmuramoyl-pentapeptide-transferase [Spartobacteria bacterium]
MLYYLSEISTWASSRGIDNDILKALNVFSYITFRAICAGITAFVLSLAFGNLVIRKLISLKFGQPIRTAAEVHKLHELHGSKKGTPTMGGVLLIGTVVVSTLLWAKPENPFVWLVLFSTVFMGGIGLYDDWLKVSKKSSDGISSRMKFALQCLLAGIFTVFLLLNPKVSTIAQQLYFPFIKDPLLPSMGLFSFIFFLLVIVGTSNAVNLTDGLDGLATGCTATVAATYAVLVYVAGNIKAASYLQIPYVAYSGELAVLCVALLGACLGFLWWNAHPARVFMGDTGSLAIGGMLGSVAICCKQEILLVIVGGVFVIEAMSVIIQVASFKLTGRRIFKMSPIHHHFELSGWKENTVIVRFWILSVLFALLGLATLKLR